MSTFSSQAHKLIEAAKSNHELIGRVNALAELGEIAPALTDKDREEVDQVMANGCRSNLAEVRRESFHAWSKFARPGEIPTGLICIGLSERNSDIASFAADCVLTTKEFTGNVIDALTATIESGTHKNLLETIPAIRAAAAMQRPPPSLSAAMLDALQADDQMVEAEALVALVGWHRNDGLVVSKIESLLDSPGVLVRLRSLDALAAMPGSAGCAELGTLLQKCLHDPNPAVRERAQQILEQDRK